ncbi:MAG TPA: hypothetical protein VFG69_08705, partial [Nannocystaceae bacterium]|nr:hypothetical protein [Nannocystaceae bacterium]
MASGDRVETETIVSREVATTRTASSASGESSASRTQLQRGASVGRFLLLARIGEGGMGSVWTAYDGDLDRKVALKLVRSDRAADDDVRARM